MKLSTQILIVLSVVTILSIADSYTNFLLTKKVQRNSDFRANSEAIIRNSNQAHKAMIDMQSAFRGYLLTNDSTFLDLYFEGKKSVPRYLSDQRKRIQSNITQRAILDSIADLHAYWVDYSGELIAARKSMPASYQALFETKLKKRVGKKINDEIARKFSRFDKIEYEIRSRHSAMLMSSIETTHTISFIFLSLSIIIGIISTVYLVRLISTRIASMVRLAEKITTGEFTVVNDTSNDELTGLSQSLNIMSQRLDTNIRQLENRNAELNNFAYVVSHDLKAPVRGIHNVVAWIEEDLQDELSPQLKKYLMIIHQKTRRMEALINGLLDYARISMKTPQEPVDTNALVHEIAGAIVPRSFTLHIGNLPQLYAERIKLEQVFENLISNAVKYTPHPNGAITIACRDAGDRYQFSVKDNGIGIAPEYHQKIFGIFQTLREKDDKESTGVGLAIVKKILDERQESIRIVSDTGKGTEFIFTWKKS